MLFIVAIAICPIDYGFDCNRTTAPDFQTFWHYRPNLEECQRFAHKMLEVSGFSDETHQARIYCVRAETWRDATTFSAPPQNQ